MTSSDHMARCERAVDKLAEDRMTNKTVNELVEWARIVSDPASLSADRVRAYAKLSNAPLAVATTLTQQAAENEALREAGQKLLTVGDDKMATRREWFEAVQNWRALTGGGPTDEGR